MSKLYFYVPEIRIEDTVVGQKTSNEIDAKSSRSKEEK